MKQLFIITLLIGICVCENCLLPLPRLSFFAPLIFYQNGTLLDTEFSVDLDIEIKIPYDQKVILSCQPNYFKHMPTKKSLEATCKGKSTFDINGELIDFHKKLACEVRNIEEILIPIDGCVGDNTNKLISIEYGFTNPVADKSYVLGEACYSIETGKTIFVHTKLYKELDLNEISLKIIENKSYFKQRHPSTRNRVEYLMATRQDLLNDRLKTLLNQNTIPILESHHFLSQSFLMSGQFQAINKLAWNNVMLYEDDDQLDLLLLSIYEYKTLNLIDLYVGTHGIATEKNNVGDDIEIYLSSDDKFPVPKYIWITVKNDNKIVSFVVPTNIQATPSSSSSANDILSDTSICMSRCNQITWLKYLLKNSPILCCEYKEFQKVIKEMPFIQGDFELLV